MSGLRASLLALALALVASASAHAELRASQPEAMAAVAEAPDTIHLTFTEGVEVDFSIFKVVRLDAEVDLAADDAELRLNGLASALIGPHLAGNGDAEAEALVEAVAGATFPEVELRVVEPLAPGHYVVMWRALSEDTHVVTGHFVFTVVEGE